MQRNANLGSGTAAGGPASAAATGMDHSRRSHRITGAALFGAAALSLSACGTPPGSFDVEDSGQTKLSNLQAMVQFKKPGRQPTPIDHVLCPDIVILDGTADDRVYGTGEQTNANLRYQFSLNDVARDCQVNGAQLSLKIGAAGKLLLGPVGSPGNFVAPIRIAIVRDNDQEPIASQLFKVPVTVAAGQTEAPFSLVTEQMTIPYSYANAQHDYTIKVGFDDPAGAKNKKPLAEASARNRPTAATSSGDTTPHHGHHHQQPPAGSSN
jgi:hypothetical protein